MVRPVRGFVFAVAAISMIVAVPVAHAETCKYGENQFDDFTGEKQLSTKWRRVAGSWARSAEAEGVTDGDQDYLAIKLESAETLGYEPYDDELRSRFVVPAGASLLILMADDTIVELAAHQEVTGKSRSDPANTRDSGNSPLKIRYRVQTKTIIWYPLNDSTFEALTSQAATHFRLSANGGDHDFELHAKLTDEIQKALLCLKQDTV